MIEQRQPKTIQSRGFWYKFAAPFWHHRTSENYESHPLHCLLLMPVGEVDNGISSKHAVMMLAMIIQFMIPIIKK